MRALLETFLVLFSVFVRQKINVTEDVRFTDYASGIWVQDCSKLAINPKNNNGNTICRNDVFVNLF